MKILFVTYDFPYPTNSGGKTRAYNLIKHKTQDVALYLFSFIRKSFQKSHIVELEKLGVKKIITVDRSDFTSLSGLTGLINPTKSIFYKLYFTQDVENKLLQVIKDEEIEIVHFESYYTGFFMGEKLRSLGVKQIFGTENIEADVYNDYIESKVQKSLQPLYRFENSKIRKEEITMIKASDSTLTVTESEKQYVRKYTSNPVYIIPNGVDLTKFTFQLKKPSQKKIVLFVGNFSYHPNVDAAEYFYSEVFTKLDSSQYEFRIIGKHAAKLSFIKENGVTGSDFVDDIIAEYHNADVFILPIRIGGGTNYKLLESMAVGLPVIALPNRLDELGITNRKEVLIAENPKHFIELLNEITTDSALRESITKHARAFIEKRYSWDTIGKEMNTVWRNIL